MIAHANSSRASLRVREQNLLILTYEVVPHSAKPDFIFEAVVSEYLSTTRV